MIKWFIKSIFRKISNGLRRLRKAPDYVEFILEGNYPDIPQPRGGFFQRRFSPPETSLKELSMQFGIIGADPRTKGVVLHLRQLSMPMSRLQTLKDLITKLQQQGKRVIVWATGYDTASYYLAAGADEILLQEGGQISPIGLRQQHVFMADALDWCGLKMDAVQITPYKAAADRLTRTGMSQEVREMTDWLMDSNYTEIIQAIAQGRKVDPAQARIIADQAPYTDSQGLSAGAVDKIISEEDLPQYLGVIASWPKAAKTLVRPTLPRPGDYVALIRIQGNIVDGRSQQPQFKPPLPIPFLFNTRAGDLTVVQLARKALQDKRAKAALVYIDSGGGSAAASEAMTAALTKLAAQKPVVAMMASVAASGGYYVATPAHWIVAQPGTITGSIGVLTGKIVDSRLMEKLLFHRQTLTRGANSDMEGSDKPYTDAQRQQVFKSITSIYQLFLKRVSQGRKLDTKHIDQVGGGRVWTGRQALAHGLVDELGGLDIALAKTWELAKSRPIPLREVQVGKGLIPPLASPLESIGYALESAKLFNNSKALCLCPLFWRED